MINNFFIINKLSSIITSYHILIYGACITSEDEDKIKELEPFKKYELPMYGKTSIGSGTYTLLGSLLGNKGGDRFIGFEYDRIYGLYDSVKYTYGDSLQLSNNIVPPQIKLLFKEKYPDLEAQQYVLVQNVYTSNHAYGYMIYGFLIKTNGRIDTIDIDFPNNFKLIDVSEGHNQHDRGTDDFNYICGIILDVFEPLENDEVSFLMLPAFHKQYQKPHLPISVSSELIRELIINKQPELQVIITNSIPMLSLVQAMCYCCT